MKSPRILINKSLIFLSDRQKGLLDGVQNVFPGCPHGYCLCHLEDNFHREFKNPDLKWKAACAISKDGFDEALNKMNGINPRAVP